MEAIHVISERLSWDLHSYAVCKISYDCAHSVRTTIEAARSSPGYRLANGYLRHAAADKGTEFQA